MEISRRTILAMRFLVLLLILDVANAMYFKITVTSESIWALTMLLIFKLLLVITITIILSPLLDLYLHSIRKMEAENEVKEQIKRLVKQQLSKQENTEDEILS